MGNLITMVVNMKPTSHDFEHVTIVICPMNSENLDSTREERVHLDPVEDVERPLPAVRIFTEV
jgi:hypothetical protein